MRARARDEVHRVSTPLELLFDLVFVVAVSLAAAHLHHGIVANHVGQALLSYTLVFFFIWWAWMNFSWFASAYDNDDVPYRLLVMVQLVGALVLAAGVPAAFESSNYGMTTLGYCLMRLALVAQGLRAWRGDRPRRPTLVRYVGGLFVLQLAWIGLLWLPVANKLPAVVVLCVLELLVPLWSEHGREPMPWHPEHIAERFGLFTIIVLGESILSASMAMQEAMKLGSLSLGLLQVAAGGLLIIFTLWWSYFQQAEHHIGASMKEAAFWGYGHVFIFASAAAVGSGLATAVDLALGHVPLNRELANAALAVPVAVFMVSVGVVHGRLKHGGPLVVGFYLTIAAILASIWSDSAVLLIGLVMAGFLGMKLWVTRKTVW